MLKILANHSISSLDLNFGRIQLISVQKKVQTFSLVYAMDTQVPERL